MPFFRRRIGQTRLMEEVDNREDPSPVAHEIDGSMMPEGVTEYDAIETLPDPLAQLQVDERNSAASNLIEKYGIVTLAQGMNVGRSTTCPHGAPGVFGNQTEILMVKAGDDINSIFTVSLSQIPLRTSSFFAAPGGPVPPGSGQDIPSVMEEGSGGGATPGYQGCYAVIQWGAGGVQYETVVDVAHGQQFTVGGSFLRILGVNTNNADDVDIAAFVSMLPRGDSLPARFTYFAGLNVNPGGQLVVSIPPFASRVRIYTPAADLSDFTIQQFNHAGVFVAANRIPPGTVVSPSIDILGDTEKMILLNAVAGVNLAAVYAVFDMNL